MSDQRDLEYGRIAVKNNFLTQEQFEDCLRMKEGLKARYGKEYDLEKILFEKGLISDTQSAVIKKVLQRKVQGGPGTGQFKRPTPPPKSDRPSRPDRTGRMERPSRATRPPGSSSHSGEIPANLVDEEIDVEAPTAQMGQATVKCGYCGQENRFGQATCSRCARYLPQPGGAPARRLVVSRQQGGSRKLWFVLGSLGASLVVGLIVFLSTRGSPSEPQPGEGAGDGGAKLAERDIADLREQVDRAGQAASAGDHLLAWDRYRAAERKADGLLKSASLDDPRRRDLRDAWEDAQSARQRIVETRRRELLDELERGRGLVVEGDWREARQIATQAEEDAKRWRELLSREGLGSGGFEEVESRARQVLGDAEQKSSANDGGAAAPLIAEFQTLARNLLSIEDASTWKGRERDLTRLRGLMGEVCAILPEGDERRREIERQAQDVEAKGRSLVGGSDPDPGTGGGSAWLPGGGTWNHVFGSDGPTAEELATGLAFLISAEDVAVEDAAYFAPVLTEGVGILIDKKGRTHRGVIEDKGSTYLVSNDGKRYSIIKSQVEQFLPGTTYLPSPSPDIVHDRTGKPYPGRPSRVLDGRTVVFDGEGAAAVGVDLSEIRSEDAYAVIQHHVLEMGDSRSHFEVALLCRRLDLSEAAREEFFEAVRLDRSLITTGLPVFRPEVFYRLVDRSVGEDAEARFRLALWARLTFREAEPFLEQFDKARQIDPSTYAGPWMRLALALWLAERKILPRAIEEARTVADDESGPDEARMRAEGILEMLEQQKIAWEAEEKRRELAVHCQAVLDAARVAALERAKAGNAWSEDRDWANYKLLDMALAGAAAKKRRPEAEVRAFWNERKGRPEAEWPTQVLELDEDLVWFAETPEVLNLAHSAGAIFEAQTAHYAGLPPKTKAELLYFLFARYLMKESQERVPCSRCKGDVPTDVEDYKKRFDGKMERLCSGCRGMGFRLSLRYR